MQVLGYIGAVAGLALGLFRPAAALRLVGPAVDSKWTRENAGGTGLEFVIGLLHVAQLPAATGA